MTRARSKLTAVLGTLCGALLLCASSARADDLEVAKQKGLFELGIYGGLFISPGDHDLMDPETANYSPFKTLSLELGLRLSYLPRAWMGIELEGGVMPSGTEAGGDALLYHARAHLLFQYPARISPFVVAGVGLLGVSSDSNVLGNDVDPELHWGIGAKAYLTRWLALRVDLRHIISDGGNRADTGLGHNSFEALLGLSVVLGWSKPAPKDSDGDGIADDKDKCPEVAANTPDGCPPKDTDGDGITDDKDKCPKVAAKTADGCPPPDTDGDGITDDKDKCPKVAAKTADGCPPKDTDGDGITDDKDKCPKVAAKTADGCPPPDTDGDGIPDDKDKCPKEPETKNGYQDEDGCPDTVPTIVKKFTGAIRGIYFAVNKAKIRPASYKTLNKAAKVLKKYADLKLIIRGHTDNTGNKAHNMKLSGERAEAVKAYLVKRGIDAARLQAVGVGPDEPVADNKTRKGRAKNRRIEFKLGG